MKNMSFFLTTAQARAKKKTVTRRLGWANLKPGERVQQVEKGQGLKKGEHPVKIHVVECVSNDRERLNEMIVNYSYGWRECEREGFPQMTPEAFVKMFCKHNKCTRRKTVNRIVFRYV
jgi:hypothetical protein